MAREGEEHDNKDSLPQKVVVHYTCHNECDKKAYQIHHFSAPIKNAHESGTYKCNEYDNVDSLMCDDKEHMIMMGIWGIILVTMNL